MQYDQLPGHWKSRVTELARELSGGRYSRLSAEAFKQQAVRVRFPDGSAALFLYAFVLTDEAHGELAVFTEHCGHHVFPLEGTLVDTHPLDSVRGTTSDQPLSRDSVVSLREVTKENLLPVLRLKVAPNQEKFVAPNSISIAEAHFDPEIAWFRAIYADETPAGFLMLEDQPDRPSYFLWRFMIDHRFQGFGFGARALELRWSTSGPAQAPRSSPRAACPAREGRGRFTRGTASATLEKRTASSWSCGASYSLDIRRSFPCVQQRSVPRSPSRGRSRSSKPIETGLHRSTLRPSSESSSTVYRNVT